MLDYDPKRRWMERRGLPCRTLNTDAFFQGGDKVADAPGKGTQAAWDEVKETCSYCPVLAECRRDTLGEEYGIWGGRDAHERFRLRKLLAELSKTWDEDYRAEWAREVHRLRYENPDDIRTFQEIRNLTGLSVALAQQLCAEEARRQRPAQKPSEPATAGSVLSLPDLPKTPGTRHLWVVHMGVVRDAYYKAHSADGTHVYVEIRDVKAMTRTWVPVDRTRFYSDPERVTKPMRGKSRYGIKAKRDGFTEAA